MGPSTLSAPALDCSRLDVSSAVRGFHMRPSILIVEPRPEVADAIAAVVVSASYIPIVRPYLETFAELDTRVDAIIIRVITGTAGEPAHAAIARLPAGRPPIVAIASEDAGVAEA